MRVRVWFIGARTHACTHARMCNCVALGLAAQCVWSISGEERAMGPRVFRLLPGQRESAREPHLQGTMRKRPAMVLCVCWGNRVNSGHVRDRIPFSCFRLFLLSHVGWTSVSDLCTISQRWNQVSISIRPLYGYSLSTP